MTEEVKKQIKHSEKNLIYLSDSGDDREAHEIVIPIGQNNANSINPDDIALVEMSNNNPQEKGLTLGATNRMHTSMDSFGNEVKDNQLPLNSSIVYQNQFRK